MSLEKQFLSLELIPCAQCHGLYWCECVERKRNMIVHITPRAYAVACGEGYMSDERRLGKQMKNPALLASIFGVQTFELPQEIDRISHRLTHQEHRYDFSIRFRTDEYGRMSKDPYKPFNDFYVVATLADEIDVLEFLTHEENGWKVPIFGGPLFNLWHPDCVGRSFCELRFNKKQ